MTYSKIFQYVAFLFFLIAIYIEIQMFFYTKDINIYQKYFSECLQSPDKLFPESYVCPKTSKECSDIEPQTNPVSCLCSMYNLLAPSLLVYKVKSNHKNLDFIRPSSSDTYIVPTIALEKADVFFGYGIWKDSSFESNASKFYKKTIYAYDCGMEKIDENNPLVVFESECIGTDKFVIEELKSSGKIHTLGQKLKQLNLEDKKIFIKMDIAGAETEVIPDLLKHSDQITGISVVVRLDGIDRLAALLRLLPKMNEKFILVYRNLHLSECVTDCNCKYMHQNFAKPVTLTYINKNLADEKYLPFNQDCSKSNQYFSPYNLKSFIPPYTINWRVVLYQKISHLLKKDNQKKDLAGSNEN